MGSFSLVAPESDCSSLEYVVAISCPKISPLGALGGRNGIQNSRECDANRFTDKVWGKQSARVGVCVEQRRKREKER